MLTCLRCDYTWEPIVASPRLCPHCKNPRWNEERRPPGRKPLNAVKAVSVPKSELEQEAEFQEAIVDTSGDYGQL